MNYMSKNYCNLFIVNYLHQQNIMYFIYGMDTAGEQNELICGRQTCVLQKPVRDKG